MITRHLVGRLEDAGDADALAGEGERREHGPSHLGGQGHLLVAADEGQGIAVLVLGDDQLGNETRQLLAALENAIGDGRAAQVKDAEALGTVDERHPDAEDVATRDHHRPLELERPPRDTRVDVLGSQVVETRRKRLQHPLLEVHQEDGCIVEATAPALLGDDESHIVRTEPGRLPDEVGHDVADALGQFRGLYGSGRDLVLGSSARDRRRDELGTQSLLAPGVGDHLLGDLAQLAILSLRGPHEDLQSLLGIAAPASHQDALGLLDRGPRADGRGQALAEVVGVPVRLGVGQHAGRLGGELQANLDVDIGERFGGAGVEVSGRRRLRGRATSGTDIELWMRGRRRPH